MFTAIQDGHGLNRLASPSHRGKLVANNAIRIRSSLVCLRDGYVETLLLVESDHELCHLRAVRLVLGPVVEETLERLDHAKTLIGCGDVQLGLPADGALAGEAPGDHGGG